MEFKKVRDFVKEHPRVAIEVVIEATGVSEDRVREFLRQGRLDVADFTGPTLQCQRCGKPIDTGTYCLLCRQDISDTFKNSADSPTKPGEKGKEKEKDKTTFARYYRNKR